MFVAVVHFPPVPARQDAEFRAWFGWSNDQLRESVGLADRRLLRDGEGAYVGLVEHESAFTFAQMHASPAAAAVQQRLHAMIEGAPRADTYDDVETAAASVCCSGGSGEADTPAGGGVEAGTGGKACCCHGS